MIKTAYAKLAQINPLPPQDPIQINTGTQYNTANDFWALLASFFNLFLIICGIAALIALIYGGIQYIASGGDENKAQIGRKTITMAITGIIIIFLALVIISFIKESLGV